MAAAYLAGLATAACLLALWWSWPLLRRLVTAGRREINLPEAHARLGKLLKDNGSTEVLPMRRRAG